MVEALKVLVVEDNEDDALLLIRELKRCGYQPDWVRVQTAADVAEQLERRVWDIVISDYAMPGFTGVAALEIMKDKGIDLPFIIVSGTIGEDTAVEAMRAGAHDYLMKGNLTRLGVAIERELREAKVRRERKEARQALGLTEERYRHLFEHSPVALIELDLEGAKRHLAALKFGNDLETVSQLSKRPKLLDEIWPLIHIRDVNNTFLQLFKVGSKREVYESFISRCMGGNREQWNEMLTVLLGGQASFSTELIANSFDEQQLSLFIRAMVPPASKGTLSRVMCALTDLTHSKHLEQQLQRAQKMEAVGRLAGGIAHDFNNVLTIIETYSRFAEKGLEPNSKVREDVGVIRDSVWRAAAMVKRMMAFSRHQVRQLEVLDLNKALANFVEMLGPVLGEDIALKMNLVEEVPVVVADKGQLEQCLMNLVINARDAMPDGGELTLSTTDKKIDDQRSVELGVSPGRYAAIGVVDTGVGIDDETVKSIFEPFYTTKPEGKGTGLGLASVKNLISQMRGGVTVHSELGVGTKFELYLPRSLEESVAARASIVPQAPAGRAEKVLVVEDDAPLRRAICRSLKQNEYEVLDAANGADALQLALAESAIDLVLTDVVLPKVGGLELAEQLATKRPKIKIMFMSGYAAEESLESIDLGGNAVFLRKPFSIEDLLSTVRIALENSANGLGQPL